VVGDALVQFGFAGPPHDYQQRLAAIGPVGGQLSAAVQRAKQRRPFLARDADRLQVGVQVFLRFVVRGHGVLLASHLMQGNPPAFALLVVILVPIDAIDCPVST